MMDRGYDPNDPITTLLLLLLLLFWSSVLPLQVKRKSEQNQCRGTATACVLFKHVVDLLDRIGYPAVIAHSTTLTKMRCPSEAE